MRIMWTWNKIYAILKLHVCLYNFHIYLYVSEKTADTLKYFNFLTDATMAILPFSVHQTLHLLLTK